MDDDKLRGIAVTYVPILMGTAIIYTVGVATAQMGGNLPRRLCESQAPRVTASTPSDIFNRCTRELPDGTVLTWNRDAQHKKDLQSGAALTLK